MRRSILITMDNEAWPEINFALYLYDPDERGKIAPKIQRTSLYDTALPNCEVHASNAMREICSDLIKNGKEMSNYARAFPQKPEGWSESEKSPPRVRPRQTSKWKQKRTKSQKPQASVRHSNVRTAKGKKAKVRKRR